MACADGVRAISEVRLKRCMCCETRSPPVTRYVQLSAATDSARKKQRKYLIEIIWLTPAVEGVGRGKSARSADGACGELRTFSLSGSVSRSM